MNEREKTLNRIQQMMNHCIYYTMENYKNTFNLKAETKTNDELLSFEQDERDHVLDELFMIYEKYPFLRSIQEHVDDSNFIQISGFIFWLPSEDQDKWLSSHHNIPTYEDFCMNKKILDNSLPYFSTVYELVVKEKYVRFLKERINESKEKIKTIEIEKEVVKKKSKDDKIVHLNSKTKKLKAKEEKTKTKKEDINKERRHKGQGSDNTINTNDKTAQKTFKHNLSNNEIIDLARCIRVTEIIEEEVSTELLKSILDCEPGIQLHSKSNTLLVYFFRKLAEKGRICKNWMDVIEYNKLFIGPKKAILKATNLANVIINPEASNEYKIIDNYFKYIPFRADLEDV